MPKRELERLLDELDRELSEGGSLDADEQASLRELQVRIEALLGSEEQPADAAGLTEPLAGLVDRFETSHPTLTMILARIMDSLGKMGI
jgi:hypothetical protein